MTVLIDSNIIIGFLKGENTIVNYIKKVIKQNTPLFISSISVYEVHLGIIANLYLKQGRPHIVDDLMQIYNQFLQTCTILDFSKDSAERSANIYAQAQGKGISIKQNDCFIAGTALTYGVSMILTRDKKDFEKINKISGIKFESL